MTAKTFRIMQAVLAGVLGGTAAWSIMTQNYTALVAAIIVAIGLVYLIRTRTKEIMKDERSILLYEKAAGVTVRFCVPAIAIVSAIIALLQDKLPSSLGPVSSTLAYTACGLLLVHAALYSFYSRKH